MIGTGIYLDPVETAKFRIISEVETLVQQIRGWLLVITGFASLLAIAGVSFTLRERTFASRNLARAAGVVHDEMRAVLRGLRSSLEPLLTQNVENPANRIRETLEQLEGADAYVRKHAHRIREAADKHQTISRRTAGAQEVQLGGAVRVLCSRMELERGKAGQQLEIRVTVCGELDLPAALKAAALGMVREALMNSIRHGVDVTTIDILLEHLPHELRLSVCDNGRDGSKLLQRLERGRLSHEGIGIVDVMEEAESLGGVLTVNVEPGRTEVLVVVPLHAPPASGAGISENLKRIFYAYRKQKSRD
jgi:signal transduction histidine kinase